MNVTSIIKRGAFLAGLLGISAASAFANSELIVVDGDNDYVESFANWTEGELVANQVSAIDGWRAAADDASTITNLGGEAGNALNLNTEGQTLSVNFDSPAFDYEDELFVDATVKTALFLNADNKLVIYHGASVGGTPVGTNTVTGVELSPDTFYHLTIEMVSEPEEDVQFFKYYIDGVPVVGAVGEAFTDDYWFADEKDYANPPGGCWFLSAVQNAYLNAIAFQGTGLIDDLSVSYSAPSPVDNYVAAVIVGTETNKYDTFAEAYADAADGNTILLLDDIEGNGITINKSITIDFGGHTYTVNVDPAGSTGTKSQAFQILQSAGAVTFRNGTITSTDVVKMLVNNYTDLTLDNMVLDGTHMGVAHKAGTEEVVPNYTLSNNSGTSTLTNGTVVTSKGTGHFAMDTYDSAGYSGVPSVVVNGATINGDVELSGGNLNLMDGELAGALVATAVGDGLIQKADDFIAAAPDGYEWDENGILVEVSEDPYPNSVKAGDITIVAEEDGGAPLSFGTPVVGASTVTIPFTATIVGVAGAPVSGGLYLQVKYDLTSDAVDTVAGTFTFGDNNSVEIALPTGKAMLFAVGITDTPANAE